MITYWIILQWHFIHLILKFLLCCVISAVFSDAKWFDLIVHINVNCIRFLIPISYDYVSSMWFSFDSYCANYCNVMYHTIFTVVLFYCAKHLKLYTLISFMFFSYSICMCCFHVTSPCCCCKYQFKHVIYLVWWHTKHSCGAMWPYQWNPCNTVFQCEDMCFLVWIF